MSDFIRKSLHELIEKPVKGTRPKGGVTYEGDIPSFGGENVTMTGGLDFYPVKKVSSEFFHQMKRGQLQDLDVVISENTGKSAIYRKSPYKYACINEHLFILRGNKGQLAQIYLHYLLQFPNVKNTLETKIIESVQPSLNSSSVKTFLLKLLQSPNKRESHLYSPLWMR